MILVVGATGRLGGLVTKALLAEGRRVRILVRSGSDSGALVDAGAIPIAGDLKDPKSLLRAAAGIDSVIATANSARRGGGDNPQTVDLEGNARLIEAARAAGVRRYVFMTALGAEVDSVDPFMSAKATTEQRLITSGLDYTIVAATPFIDVWVGMVVLNPVLERREVVYSGDGNRRYSMVAMADVASTLVAVIDDPESSHRYVPVAGPSAFSWRDAVRTFEGALGHSIPMRGLPIGEPVPGLPGTVQGMMAFLAANDLELNTSDTARRLGVSLTSLDEWVHQALQPLRSTDAV